MNKITINLNLSKIDKSKIVERVWKDKEGNEIKEKVYSFDLIPLKERKFVSKGDTWTMFKTHFGAEKQTKEQRDAKEPSNFVADGMQFENIELTSAGTKIPDFSEVDNSDIPF